MAAPGFGFSFGDFVQAISLLHEVHKALRETGGATDEFKTVLLEIQHLQILLEHLNQGSWAQNCDVGHINAVKGMALTCQVPIRAFLEKVRKYQVLVRDEEMGLGRRMERGVRKAQWAVVMKGEVEKFRVVVMAKVVSINLLLQLNTVSTASRIESRTATFQENVKRRLDVLEAKSSDAHALAEAHCFANRSISRLALICAGTNTGVEDLRKCVATQKTEVQNSIKTLQLRQTESFQSFARSFQGVACRLYTIESLLRELLRAFGSFSSTALSLLRQILGNDIETYKLLTQIQQRLPQIPTLVKENCIKFTDALHRTSYLDYRYFKYWEVLEVMIKWKGSWIDPERWELWIILNDICPAPGCGRKVKTIPGGNNLEVTCASCLLSYHRTGIWGDLISDADFTINLNAELECSQSPSLDQGSQLVKGPGSAIASRSKEPIFLFHHEISNEMLWIFKEVNFSFGYGQWPRLALGYDWEEPPTFEHIVAGTLWHAEYFVIRILDWLVTKSFSLEFEQAFLEVFHSQQIFFRNTPDRLFYQWELINKFGATYYDNHIIDPRG